LFAEYFQGSVASCQNGRSFTWGAFTLKKYFFPFLPFGPLDQLHLYLPSSEKDVHDVNEDGGALDIFPFAAGGGGGTEESLRKGGLVGLSAGSI
jgi:hypothetical protein